jgi:DNA-directed RNA polymerase specialized sigma24 family protein
MEELVKQLYTELYLTIKEIADIVGDYPCNIAPILWKERLERSGGKTQALRKKLKTLPDEQKAEYIHKARQLGVPYKLIAKVLGLKQREVRRLERSLSSRV